MNDSLKIKSAVNTLRRSIFVSIGILSFILLAGWFAISNTIINSDMQQFLPKNSVVHSSSNINPIKILNVLNETNSGLFLLSINGGSDSQRATASIKLRKMLIKDKQFIFVNNGSGRLPKEDRALIKKYRYLLSSKHDDLEKSSFSENALEFEFKERYQEILSPLGGLLKRSIPYDPTAEMRYILNEWQLGKEPHKKRSVWFSDNYKSALLVTAIHIKGIDINAQQHAIETIKQTFSEIKNKELKLTISGAGVFAVQARKKIKAESQQISFIASIAVMLFMFIAFRSFWYVFLAVIPLLSAIICGTILTQFIFGSIQGITLAFGLTLIGVALDYPVHVFSHIIPNESVKQSIKNIWPTMRLGAITTSFGFFALTQTNFNGLAQLGVFAMSGLLTAALITRYILPYLITLRPVRQNSVIPKWVKQVNCKNIKFNTINTILIISVAIILLFNFPIHWESDIAKLSPVSLEQLSIDRKLRKQLNADDLVNVAILKAKDSNGILLESEELSSALDEMVKLKIITSYRAPSHILPSTERQRKRQHNLPDSIVLEQNVKKALEKSHFSAKSFNLFRKEVEESKLLAPLDKQNLNGTLLDRQLSAMLFKNQNEWFGIIRFIGVKDKVALSKRLENLDDQDIKYLNIKEVSQSIVNGFRDEALILIAIGLVIIFMTLLVGLRDNQRLIRVCFIVGAALSFNILTLNILGQALSIFHLISLLLVLGLGLDYSLFFTRRGDNKEIRARTSYGMLVCFGSTALVFGMLALSNIPVLRAIGLTVFIGVSFCFLFAMLLSDMPKNLSLQDKVS